LNILLTNDDGITADGIMVLYKHFSAVGHDVYIVAPKFEKSAQSHAVTTREPLRIEAQTDRIYAVTGTPADCVIMAFEYILRELNPVEIDLVISGINAGQNLGDDVLYSGTVAAAVEAACYGKKAIAISTTSYSNQRYDTAAIALIRLIEAGLMDYIGYREIVNVNVPNIDISEIQGVTIAQTGFRRYQNIIKKHTDNRNKDIFWLGGESPMIDSSDYEIDSHAIRENKVSISPLRIDWNDYQKIKPMSERFVHLFGENA
jgi:5'-nucleotidase